VSGREPDSEPNEPSQVKNLRNKGDNSASPLYRKRV